MNLGKEYTEFRPIVRAVIAFVFYCMDRKMSNGSMSGKHPENAFVEADSFLTSFEQNRN